MKALFRLALLLVILIGVGGFFLGWWGTPGDRPARTGEEIGTTGRGVADEAREAGREVGDRAATAANQAKLALEDGALTAKIKSKMALDDLVRARGIDVDTVDGVVTLGGTVSSEQERQRAVRLATETAGVKSVTDQLRVVQ